MIPSSELALLRADLTGVLADSCAVVRVTRTQTDSGGWTEATTTQSAQPCRVGPLSGRERIAGGKIAEEADLVVTLAYDADIRSDDRITHGGKTYEVVSIDDRTDRLVRRVYVRRTS